MILFVIQRYVYVIGDVLVSVSIVFFMFSISFYKGSFDLIAWKVFQNRWRSIPRRLGSERFYSFTVFNRSLFFLQHIWKWNLKSKTVCTGKKTGGGLFRVHYN